MKIGYKYYKLASKALTARAIEKFNEYHKVRKAWVGFAKEVGADDRNMWVGSGFEDRLLGVTFKIVPDTTAWMRVEHNYWRPRGNGTRKDLYKAFKALPKWTTEDLATELGYKGLFDSGYYYKLGSTISKKGAVFKVPVFDVETKDNTYTPIKGVKEISLKAYQKFLQEA